MKITELFVSKRTEDFIRQLSTKKDADRKIRILRKRRALSTAVTFVVTALLAVVIFAAESAAMKKPVAAISRNESGKGKKTMTLKAVTDDGYAEDITVDINERKYSDKELRIFSGKITEMFPELILGKNQKAENVIYDLDLKNNIEGFPFDITYKSDRPDILSSSGNINKERLKEKDPGDEGVPVMICATLRYGKYSEDIYSYIVLHAGDEDYVFSASEALKESVKQADEESENDRWQKLPSGAGERKVEFYETSSGRIPIVLLTGLIIPVFFIVSGDRKIKDKTEKRKRQMDSDHPRILERYMLYYTAGMNPRAVWAKICSLYEEDLKDPKAEKRYAYEEMLAAKRRMDEGCGELAAYDGFAERCDNIKFRSFVSLVKQAVVKGNDGLDILLREEAEKARREKLDTIRLRASEAETKMLLPMFMILIDILAIVMIPAFILMGTG